MRQLIPNLLWIGNALDARDIQTVLSLGIRAVVDLAANEPPIQYPRDITYCRFPLNDGLGNEPPILRLAVSSTAEFIRSRTPTLVACSAGMSRSPAVVAAALAQIEHQEPDVVLVRIASDIPHDVSPALWSDIKGTVFPSDETLDPEATAPNDNTLPTSFGFSVATNLKAIPAKTTPPAKPGTMRKYFIYGAVIAAFLGVLMLAGVILSLKTKDGTLVVEVDQPDAMVQVLDAEGKVEISTKGRNGKITIGVDPGRHRLKVEKDGFTVFGHEFEIKAGEKKMISVNLLPTTAIPIQPSQSLPGNQPRKHTRKKSDSA